MPSDTAGLCDMCAILIQGLYYSLSKTNLCLYVIKRGFINFRHLRSDVTDVHPSRPYYLTAWLQIYHSRRQIDLRRSGYFSTQPRRVISRKNQRDPIFGVFKGAQCSFPRGFAGLVAASVAGKIKKSPGPKCAQTLFVIRPYIFFVLVKLCVSYFISSCR